MKLLSGAFAKDVPAIFGEDRHKLYFGYQFTGSEGLGDGPYPQFKLDVLCNWLKCLFPESAQTVKYHNYQCMRFEKGVPGWYEYSPEGGHHRKRPRDVDDFLREQYLTPIGCGKVQLERLIKDAIAHSKEPEMLNRMLTTTEQLTPDHWWQLKPEYAEWVMEVAEFMHDRLAKTGSNEQVFAKFSTTNLTGVMYAVLKERIETSHGYRSFLETIDTIAGEMSGCVFYADKKRMFVETVEGPFRREALEQVGQYCYQQHIANVDSTMYYHRGLPITGTSLRWAVKGHEPETRKWQ